MMNRQLQKLIIPKIGGLPVYAQTKPNPLPHNGAYGIVMRGVHFCTCAGASLRDKKALPLCCIIYRTATDPCMGSGHILVYAFDVLMDIYTSCGWSERDAALSILQHNLYGLDIDRRAYQLAYFAVMMKARQYNRSIIKSGEVQPNLANFADVMGVDTGLISGKLREFAEQFAYADTYGSLMEIAAPSGLDEAVSAFNVSFGMSRKQLDMMVMIYKILSQKYDVVCTNPPYMGGSNMNAKLSEFVKKNFPDSKSDLFACFIEKCGQLIKQNGFYAMITQHAWMFLSSYENLRKKLMLKTTVDMAHLGARAFDEIGGEVVQTTAFVMTGHIADYKGTYARLVDIVGENEKRELFLSGEKRYAAKQENFSKIPGMPVAYWVSENVIKAYGNKRIQDYLECKSGIMAGDDRFIKMWFEVLVTTIKFDCVSYTDMGEYKWFPLNSGGEFRKWYGNNIKIINLFNDGAEIKASVKNYRLREKSYYFKKGITWGRITSSQIAFRDVKNGTLFGDAGPIGFTQDNKNYILGFLCSNVSLFFLEATNPTLNYQVRDIESEPLILPTDKTEVERVNNLVEDNIQVSKADWDSFETSWDFEQHPLV